MYTVKELIEILKLYPPDHIVKLKITESIDYDKTQAFIATEFDVHDELIYYGKDRRTNYLVLDSDY